MVASTDGNPIFWITIEAPRMFFDEEWTIKQPGSVKGKALLALEFIKTKFEIVGVRKIGDQHRQSLPLRVLPSNPPTPELLKWLAEGIDAAAGVTGTRVIYGSEVPLEERRVSWVTIIAPGMFADDEWVIKEPGTIKGKAILAMDVIKERNAILGMEKTDSPDKFRVYLGYVIPNMSIAEYLTIIANDISIAAGIPGVQLVNGIV